MCKCNNAWIFCCRKHYFISNYLLYAACTSFVLFSAKNTYLLKGGLLTPRPCTSYINLCESNMRHGNKIPGTVLPKEKCSCCNRIHWGKPRNVPFLATFLAWVAHRPRNLHHCLSFFKRFCQFHEQICVKFRR